MAQTANIAIPARFSFRPYRARWEPCWAEILGWYEKPEPRTSLGIWASPTARILKGDPEFEKRFNSEKVLVSVSVPSAEDIESGSALLRLYLGSPIYTVAINRMDIPVDVLLLHEDRKSTLDISGREFPVLAFPSRIFEDTLILLRDEMKAPNMDAWEMRNEFMALQKDAWELSAFLNRWGLWDGGRGYETGIGSGLSPYGFVLAFPHLIWEKRDRFIKGLAGRPTAWLKSASLLSFTQSSQPPYFSMERSYCESAIEATISIDHLRNLKYRICKLKDCQKPYQVKTKQPRMYCSTKCAHLANVRKLRAQKKKAESKQKGAKRNAKG